jgi:hypothetical protein
MRDLDTVNSTSDDRCDILGPTQRVDVMTALKAMTIWPAWAHFEDQRKGSIEVGKLADLVMLSEDPTAIDPETLNELTIIETIKEGTSIYQAGVKQGTLDYRPRRNGVDPFQGFVLSAAASGDHASGRCECHALMRPFTRA